MNTIWLCRYKLKPFIQPMFSTYDEDTSGFDWFPFPREHKFKSLWNWCEFYIVNKPVFDKYKCDSILIDFKDRTIALCKHKITLIPVLARDHWTVRVDNDIIG